VCVFLFALFFPFLFFFFFFFFFFRGTPPLALLYYFPNHKASRLFPLLTPNHLSGPSFFPCPLRGFVPSLFWTSPFNFHFLRDFFLTRVKVPNLIPREPLFPMLSSSLLFSSGISFLNFCAPPLFHGGFLFPFFLLCVA